MQDRTILLVEDDPDDVELTKMALEQNRIVNALFVARDGQEALDWLFREGDFTERDPNQIPSVVLLDIKLPKLTGLDVLERMRRDPRTKLIPVVILTSSKEETDVARSYELHANSYIRKPVDFEHFTKAVRDIGLYWLLLNECPNSGG
jgi:two-component system response regulator